MNPHRLAINAISVALYYITCVYQSFSFASSVIENVQVGVCKTSPDDVTLWGLSYSGCVEECLARPDVCASVSFRRMTGNCRIHIYGATMTSCTDSTGYVYSEKTKWKTDKLPGCGVDTCSPRQRCGVGTCSPRQRCASHTDAAASQCAYHECRGFLSPHNGDVYGNVATVHGKLVVRCNVGYEMAGKSSITCLQTGQWDNASPICKPIGGGLTTTTAPIGGGLTTTTAPIGRSLPTTTTLIGGGLTTTTAPIGGGLATTATTIGGDLTTTTANPNCDIITCEDKNRAGVICQTEKHISTATVRTKMGTEACTHGGTHGGYHYAADELHVYNGCRAKFEVCY